MTREDVSPTSVRPDLAPSHTAQRGTLPAEDPALLPRDGRQQGPQDGYISPSVQRIQNGDQWFDQNFYQRHGRPLAVVSRIPGQRSPLTDCVRLEPGVPPTFVTYAIGIFAKPNGGTFVDAVNIRPMRRPGIGSMFLANIGLSPTCSTPGARMNAVLYAFENSTALHEILERRIPRRRPATPYQYRMPPENTFTPRYRY